MITNINEFKKYLITEENNNTVHQYTMVELLDKLKTLLDDNKNIEIDIDGTNVTSYKSADITVSVKTLTEHKLTYYLVYRVVITSPAYYESPKFSGHIDDWHDGADEDAEYDLSLVDIIVDDKNQGTLNNIGEYSDMVEANFLTEKKYIDMLIDDEDFNNAIDMINNSNTPDDEPRD